MTEEFISKQISEIIDFELTNNCCDYVIVSDIVSDSMKRNYDVKIITNNNFTEKNGRSIEDMGNGAYNYMDNTLYIAVPYKSDEFTLLRTLTHEYGHCIQDRFGYNASTCDWHLLEYHNIWFNENPNNRDVCSIFNRIDRDSGFRLSLTSPYIIINPKQYNDIDKYFNVSFDDFCKEIEKVKKVGYVNERISHKLILRDMHEFIRNKLNDYAENKLYYTLFYSFLHNL